MTGREMYGYLERLFPLCRSITGNGVRESFTILQEIAPIRIDEVASGTEVLDWTIPLEWNVHEAYVADSSGKRIIDFRTHNLHLVGYSAPFEGKLTLAQLQEHLHSLPEQPDVIPYVTSYYAKRWGFCIPHRQRQALTEQIYTVNIDSTLTPGSMTMGDLVIPGTSNEEILLSTYICHPSMANNELSGPIVAAFLARELAQRGPRHYSYRFVFVPETIGAIAYIAKHLEQLKRAVKAGYVITCVGDPGPFSYLESRLGNRLVDRISAHVLKHAAKDYFWYDWLERGSDERQYGWPGIDLPVGSLMRTKYGQYSQYHTSADNLDFVTVEALEGSLTMYLRCIDALEANHTYLSTTLCEPQLGRRGLYPTLSTRESGLSVRTLVNVAALSDGKTDLLTIAERLNKPIWELHLLANQLVEAQVLRKV